MRRADLAGERGIRKSQARTAWLWLDVCVAVFVALKYLISFIVLSSVFRVEIDARFDHPDVIDLYFASSNRTIQGRHVVSASFPKGERVRRTMDINDGVARKIRIDLGRSPGQVEVYGISLMSHFGRRIDLAPRQILADFNPNGDVISRVVQQDRLVVVTRGVDPSLLLKGELIEENWFVGIVLPVLYAFVFYLFVSNFSFANFPALADLQGKTSSLGAHISTLDGIRGLAALLVLGEHTGVVHNMGLLGVWFFFALSGFLLATPFVQQPSRALSYGYMSRYLLRRFKRLMPMYYAFVGVTMLAHGRTDEVLRHLLFLQANGHYWTLPQEMFFYLVLPFVVGFIYIAFRDKKLHAIAFLLTTLIAVNSLLREDMIWLYGEGHKMLPMLGVFFSGMVFSYLYHWLGENALFLRLDRERVRRWASILGIALLLVLMIFSERMIPAFRHFNAENHRGIFGFGAGLFILLVVLANNTVLSRIMNFTPFRAIGIVGLSFYLIHPMIINFVRTEVLDFTSIRISGVPMFLSAGIITYILSAFTYTYVERPFLKGGEHKSSLPAGTVPLPVMPGEERIRN